MDPMDPPLDPPLKSYGRLQDGRIFARVRYYIIHVELLCISYNSAAITCSTPQRPMNGYVSYTSTRYNHAAHYICFNGYKLVGSLTRTLLAVDGGAVHSPAAKVSIIIMLACWYRLYRPSI